MSLSIPRPVCLMIVRRKTIELVVTERLQSHLFNIQLVTGLRIVSRLGPWCLSLEKQSSDTSGGNTFDPLETQ